MVFNLLINGVHWGSNPLTHHLLVLPTGHPSRSKTLVSDSGFRQPHLSTPGSPRSERYLLYDVAWMVGQEFGTSMSSGH